MCIRDSTHTHCHIHRHTHTVTYIDTYTHHTKKISVTHTHTHTHTLIKNSFLKRIPKENVYTQAHRLSSYYRITFYIMYVHQYFLESFGSILDVQ